MSHAFPTPGYLLTTADREEITYLTGAGDAEYDKAVNEWVDDPADKSGLRVFLSTELVERTCEALQRQIKTTEAKQRETGPPKTPEIRKAKQDREEHLRRLAATLDRARGARTALRRARNDEEAQGRESNRSRTLQILEALDPRLARRIRRELARGETPDVIVARIRAEKAAT